MNKYYKHKDNFNVTHYYMDYMQNRAYKDVLNCSIYALRSITQEHNFTLSTGVYPASSSHYTDVHFLNRVHEL